MRTAFPIVLSLPVLLSCLWLVACPQDLDDDSATADDDAVDDDSAPGDDDAADDDSAGDDDSAPGDDDAADDDSAGDDDDSAGPEPCQDIPPLDPVEWSPVTGAAPLHSAQGAWPPDAERAWTWFVPTDAVAADLYDDFGPISGLTLPQLQDLFDEATEDALVVSWWQNADGECLSPQGPYWNNLVDCFCMSFWLHRDHWQGGKLPAKWQTAQVWVMPDQGWDAYPEMVITEALVTEREIPAP